mmetsp:Transcript_37449/g.55139  ORF Transcript_37449/g.55139 Transcript_37449/m.55139 type:complete len:238 (-) Transcript_37449:449-1162(-)
MYSENASIRADMAHLLARYLEIRPLFLAVARPMKEEWKMRPYLGVLPLVFKARKRAFSAPRICTVEAGHLARLVREPACEMRRAATTSPMSAARFGATVAILACKYAKSCWRYSCRATTLPAKRSMWCKSVLEMSIPMDILEAARMRLERSSSRTSLVSSSSFDSSNALRSPIRRTTLVYWKLLLTWSNSSGKCHEYHSRTRIANVLRSLSIWSMRAMAWMIMLSERLMLNLTLARE